MMEAYEEVIGSLEERLRKIREAKELAKGIKDKQRKRWEQAEQYQKERSYKG